MLHFGTSHVSKSDEFSEKFKTAFDPPLIFGKLHCAFRDKIVTKVRMFIWRHCCVLYDPISHEMHVQHGNWLKTYPKKTLLYHFHAEKALFKGPNFAI